MLNPKGRITSFFQKKNGPALPSVIATSNFQMKLQRLRSIKEDACKILSVTFENKNSRPTDLTKYRRKLIEDSLQIIEEELKNAADGNPENQRPRTILDIMLMLNPALVPKAHGGDLIRIHNIVYLLLNSINTLIKKLWLALF